MSSEEVYVPREPLSVDKEKRQKLVTNLKNAFTVTVSRNGETSYVADKPQKVQETVDAVYSEEYQIEKLKEASLDEKGRPVRYYRQISTRSLLMLLESGHDNPVDRHKEDFSLEDMAFVSMLEVILSDRGIDSANMSTIGMLHKVFKNIGVEEVNKVFGVNGEVTNWESILSFIEENLQPDEIKGIHAMGNNGPHRVIKYSPFMSVNPGGPRFASPHDTVVIIEMVIPDDKVVLNNKSVYLAEREALVHGVDVSYISRIIVGEDSFRKLIQENQETPVGEFIASHGELNAQEAHQKWLLTVPISETMPAKK